MAMEQDTADFWGSILYFFLRSLFWCCVLVLIGVALVNLKERCDFLEKRVQSLEKNATLTGASK